MNALFEALTGLRFANPWLLALALLVPAAIAWRRWRREPAIAFGPGRFLFEGGPLPRTWRVRLRLLPPALGALGLLFAVVALARPVEQVAIPRVREGIDVLLVLDTSSSMAANDLDPDRSRLEVAKAAAARFVAGRPDDRVGLITFARYADVRCPATPDHEALAGILEGVARVENDGPEDATGIGTAVARAAEVLQNATDRSRVVILLTDGEENVATADQPDEIAPQNAAQLAESLGVKVYAIAVGIGATDGSGRFVPVDTRQIRDLAERTGGRFWSARDADAVSGVYAAIDRLERADLPEPRIVVRDRYRAFLAAALALLLLGRLLGAGPLRVLP